MQPSGRQSPVISMNSTARSITTLLSVFLLLWMSACIPPARNVPSLNKGSGDSNGQVNKDDSTNNVPDIEPSSNDAIWLSRELPCRVVGVHDGDTITVLDATKRQHKIRLSGIDAPELSQDFGRRSKENLSGLVFGKDVVVIHDKVDRWGRIVGKVMVSGSDGNLAMIEAGLAWHFKKYEKEQTQADRIAYADAEVRARQSRTGLWSQPNPVPPWDYRGR